MTQFLYCLLLYYLSPSSLLHYPHCHNVSCSRSHIFSLLLQQKYPKQLPCFQANPFQYEAARVGFLKCCYVYHEFNFISKAHKDFCDMLLLKKLLASLERQSVFDTAVLFPPPGKPFQSLFKKLLFILHCSGNYGSSC